MCRGPQKNDRSGGDEIEKDYVLLDKQEQPKKSILRRMYLTMCAMTCTFFLMVPCTALYILATYYAPHPVIRTLLFLYGVWIMVLDKAPTRGGWDQDTKNAPFLFGWFLKKFFPKFDGSAFREACRSSFIFRGAAEYYDMELIKTVDLEPTRNYLFLYHPHGVNCMGFNMALGSNGCNFDKKFPGIHRSGVTIEFPFHTPIIHEWLLSSGYITPHRKSLVKQLTTKEPFHKSVVLIPGGAAEAMHAHPGVLRLVLKKRRGFIRIAMETGCSVIPCLGFGENEVYDTLYGMKDEHHKDNKHPNHHNTSNGNNSTKGHRRTSFSTWFKKMLVLTQTKAKEILTFAPIVVTHLVPKPRKIVVVVGEPMHFEKTTEFSPEDIDKHHQRYIEELQKLFDKFKGQYGMEGLKLEIL